MADLLFPSIPTRPMKALSAQSVQYTYLHKDDIWCKKIEARTDSATQATYCTLLFKSLGFYCFTYSSAHQSCNYLTLSTLSSHGHEDHSLGATITKIATIVSQCQSFVWDSRKSCSVFWALQVWKWLTQTLDAERWLWDSRCSMCYLHPHSVLLTSSQTGHPAPTPSCSPESCRPSTASSRPSPPPGPRHAKFHWPQPLVPSR